MAQCIVVCAPSYEVFDTTHQIGCTIFKNIGTKNVKPSPEYLKSSFKNLKVIFFLYLFYLKKKTLPVLTEPGCNAYAVTLVPANLVANSFVNKTLANLDWLYAFTGL